MDACDGCVMCDVDVMNGMDVWDGCMGRMNGMDACDGCMERMHGMNEWDGCV